MCSYKGFRSRFQASFMVYFEDTFSSGMDSRKLIKAIKDHIDISPLHDVFAEQPWFTQIDNMPQEALEKLYAIVLEDNHAIVGMMDTIGREHPEALLALEHDGQHMVQQGLKDIEEEQHQEDVDDIETQLNDLP